MRIGINGFGRIGRNFMKALGEFHPDVEIVAVNDLTSAAECAHLFKYDSNYGPYTGTVSVDGDSIVIDGKSVKVLAELGRRCAPPVGKATINGRIVALMRLVRRVRGPQEPRAPSA